ncbi:hypothetical protein PV797_20960 [Clostridiaceae bacterium M8S5]|nr:hypothetical protein PV797_20960 [Clostridiaceae bacterium M8S5]
MIKLICGLKGTGKKPKLIKLANENQQSCKGDIVFIEPGNKSMHDLKHNIRLIDAMDFDIENIENFYGFLCGIISENYDIKEIYINRIYKIFDFDNKELKLLMSKLEKLNTKFDIDFYLTLRINKDDLPQEYIENVI